MKKLCCSFLFMLFSISALHAQQFIGINPAFGLKGQTLTTVVTGSDFFFTWGSTPSTWGDFYMDQNGVKILPNSVNVMNDDVLEVEWSIPSNTPIGNYAVIWDYNTTWGGIVNPIPGGFDVECISPPAQILNAIPVVFCVGSSVLLQANTGTGYTYQWYKGALPISGATNSTHSVNVTGNYRVRVSNASGCPSFSDLMYVYSSALPSAIITPSTNQVICPGNSKSFTASTSSSYQWYKNGNILNGITTKTITVTDTGSYTVRVSNSYGCTKLSNSVALSFAAIPPSWVNANGPLTFCAGNSVTLKTAAGYSYQWYKYGNLIVGETNQSLVATSAGSYKVVVTNVSGCTKKSGAKIVTVLNSPSAIITPSGPTSICAGDSVKLNASNGSGYTYLWKRYGVPISGATSSSYTATGGGNYKVLVNHPNGCSKTSSATNVSVVCRLASSTQLSENEYDIAPNPANDYIAVHGENISKIEIRNLEGKIVSAANESKTENINISSFSPGLYVAIIYTNNGIVTKRFMKQ